MSYSTKIREATKKFLTTEGGTELTEYQEYKDTLVKIINNLSPGELVDFAINISRHPRI
jgi:hypothetical protein